MTTQTLLCRAFIAAVCCLLLLVAALHAYPVGNPNDGDVIRKTVHTRGFEEDEKKPSKAIYPRSFSPQVVCLDSGETTDECMEAVETMRQIPQWHCLRYRRFDLVKRCRNYRNGRKH